jgi:prevent-host-death family protein
MKVVKISEFKAKCIRILKTVARTSEAVLITHRGKPIATVQPIVGQTTGRVLGGLRGLLEVRGDIVHSDLAEDWQDETR